MACTDCGSTGPFVIGNITSITTQHCSTSPCGSSTSDTRCIVYKGPNLNCTGIYTNNTLEHIIQKIDSVLCGATGDYSTFNTYCIDDVNAITTQQQFVEGISQYVCNFKDTYNTFTGTTFVAYQTTVDDRFKLIEKPGTTSCAKVGLVSGDTLQQVLQKHSNKLCDVYSQIDVSAIDFGACYTVTQPTTLAQALVTINSQICQLKSSITSGGSILPIFNNVGSCLPTPLTTTDTLEATVNKIKTKLCTAPAFDINALIWTCVTKPSTTTTDLQGAFQAVLTKLDSISQNMPTFSGDFAVSNVNNAALCSGKNVALAVSSVADRYVAATTGDTTPGTLFDKLQAGTGVSFDTTTVSGKIIINSTAVGTNDKVKTRSADSTADYLENKIIGSANISTGLTINTTTDTTVNKVKVGSTVDGAKFFQYLLSMLESDEDTKSAFCAAVQECLPDCIIPPNVTFVYNPSTSTTTTTTTTSGGA